LAEYEEIVKKIPLPEQPIGPLAGLATRLDYLGPKVQKLESELSPKITELAEKVDKLEYTLSTLELPEGVAMVRKVEQIPFAHTLAVAGLPGSGVMLEEPAPFSGYIKQVTIHWPDGADALVDVKIGHGVVQFCPDDGFLALNDTTPTYPFNEWVNDQETIWVEMRNRDGLFPHSITVTVTLEGAA